MSRIRLTTLVICLLTPAAARAADGAVYLYLQPFPPDAARLTLAIGTVSAITSAGIEHPLTLHLKALGPSDSARQRLLASGRLPFGSYAGFILTVKQASLNTQQGDAALAVPDAPVRVDLPFAVTQRQAYLTWLTLKYAGQAAAGSVFAPAFWGATPSMPIADHAGFVTNLASNTITVFDKNLSQAVAAIDTCAGPAGMALDQHRRRAYVACTGDDEIQSIDIATGEVVDRTRVSPGDRPRELALTPDGRTLVVVNSGSNSISLFDAVSLTRQDRINVGSGPGSVLMEPGGKRAFVFNRLSSSLSVVDLANRVVAATISTDSSPLRGQFNRRGDRLFVVHDRSPYMTVLDPRQLSAVTKARLRGSVNAIAIDSVRDLVCIGGQNDTAIDFYDPNALMPLYSMRIKAGVSHLAVDVEENSLYMVGAKTRSVVVASLANRSVVSEIDVGDGPYWVAVMGEK